MKRDFLDVVGSRRPIDRLRRIVLRGAVALGVVTSGVATAQSTSTPVPAPPTSLTATIVDRSRKAAKLVLQLPSAVGTLVAQHRSHASHASHVSGAGATSSAPVPKPTPATPTTAASASAVPAGSEQITGKFDSFDAKLKILRIKDAVGTMFEFTVRDDTSIQIPGRPATRADDYLESNTNTLPFRANQQVSIGWKPSADGKKRIAVSVQ